MPLGRAHCSIAAAAAPITFGARPTRSVRRQRTAVEKGDDASLYYSSIDFVIPLTSLLSGARNAIDRPQTVC